MLDLHCHLLPGIDDGAVDLEMSLEMARMAVADGIRLSVSVYASLPFLAAVALLFLYEIDKRTADFTRRSLARFRYLQDVTGERRSELKSLFEQVNRLVAGRRLSHLGGALPELPEMLLPAARLPAGLDSLHTPPLRRTPAEQEAFDDGLSDDDRQAGLRDMEKALREALSVQRANAFIRSLPGGKGSRIESADIAVTGEKGFTDLISLLLHAESPEARFQLEVKRVLHENEPPPVDPLDGCSVERFSIIKK